MITVTLSIDGAAVTIQQQDDDIKALRAVLERLEATLEQRNQHQRIKELEALNATQHASILKLRGELEETELEYEVWKAEVFKLGEALGLGNKWTTQEALEAIEAPKSTIAAVRAAVEWGNSEPVDKPSQRAAIIARLRRALGDET